MAAPHVAKERGVVPSNKSFDWSAGNCFPMMQPSYFTALAYAHARLTPALNGEANLLTFI